MFTVKIINPNSEKKLPQIWEDVFSEEKYVDTCQGKFYDDYVIDILFDNGDEIVCVICISDAEDKIWGFGVIGITDPKTASIHLVCSNTKGVGSLVMYECDKYITHNTEFKEIQLYSVNDTSEFYEKFDYKKINPMEFYRYKTGYMKKTLPNVPRTPIEYQLLDPFKARFADKSDKIILENPSCLRNRCKIEENDRDLFNRIAHDILDDDGWGIILDPDYWSRI